MLSKTLRFKDLPQKCPNLWKMFCYGWSGIRQDFDIETNGIEEVEEFLANLSDEQKNTILNTEKNASARMVILMEHFGREDLGETVNRLLLEITDKIDSHQG